jgi:hypothetical protein
LGEYLPAANKNILFEFAFVGMQNICFKCQYWLLHNNIHVTMKITFVISFAINPRSKYENQIGT